MPTTPAWRKRDILTGVALFLATAAFTLWQNTRVAVLWDLSFLLDSSYRFSLGQLPYKTLPFPHPPLTFLLHAAIIRVFGRVYFPHILCAALEAGAATLLTWRILLRLLTSPALPITSNETRHSGAAGISVFAFAGAQALALLLAVPLVVIGIYAIYPHPIYDSDAILSILLAVYLLQRPTPSAVASLLAGAACVLPLFFKQNIGIIFLVTVLVSVATVAVIRRLQHEPIAPQLWFVTGIFAALAAALLTINFTVGLDNYLRWTITFARQRRLPGLALMLGTYHQASLLWTIPFTLVALVLLHLSGIGHPEHGAAESKDLQSNLSCHPERSPAESKDLQSNLSCHPERSAAESKDLQSNLSCHPERSAAESKDLRLRSIIGHPIILRRTALLLLTAPFLWTLAALPFSSDPSDRADQLLSLWPHLLILSAAYALWNLRPANLRATPSIVTFLPVILLATIHGTFLSQQLWGSTYALWPLLAILIALLLTQIPTIACPTAVIITATFVVCGGLYAVSHKRLSYIQLDGPITKAKLPGLRGLATPGPWIPAFEELVRVINSEIPASDGIVCIPGEDPFYFASGRTPQFPILLFDPATDPYTPEQTRDKARAHNIRWLILSRNTQLTASPYDALPAITQALLPDFAPYRTLSGYTIYRRK